MDISDWLDIDENNGTDLRQHQLKLAQNEQDGLKLKEFNQGYVEGTEWANEHYAELEIAAIPSLRHHFSIGLERGKSSAAERLFKFTVVGKLNVLMLLGKQKEKVAQLLSQLDKKDYDAEIGLDLRNQIQEVLAQAETELESV